MSTPKIDPNKISALQEIYPELDVPRLLNLTDEALAEIKCKGAEEVRQLLEELGFKAVFAPHSSMFHIHELIEDPADFLIEEVLRSLLSFRNQAEQLIIQAYRSVDDLLACSQETLCQIRGLSLVVDPKELAQSERGRKLVEALSYCKALEGVNFYFKKVEAEGERISLSLPGFGLALGQLPHLRSLYVDGYSSSFQRVVLNGADLEGFDQAPIESLRISLQGSPPSIAPNSPLAKCLRYLALKLDPSVAEALDLSGLRKLRKVEIDLVTESWRERPALPVDRFCKMPDLKELTVLGGDLTQITPHLSGLFPSLESISAHKFSDEKNIDLSYFPDHVNFVKLLPGSHHEVWRNWDEERITSSQIRAIENMISHPWRGYPLIRGRNKSIPESFEELFASLVTG